MRVVVALGDRPKNIGAIRVTACVANTAARISEVGPGAVVKLDRSIVVHVQVTIETLLTPRDRNVSLSRTQIQILAICVCLHLRDADSCDNIQVTVAGTVEIVQREGVG